MILLIPCIFEDKKERYEISILDTIGCFIILGS